MQAAKRHGKSLGYPLALSTEQINHAKNMIEIEQETSTGMVLLLGAHRTRYNE